MANLQLNIVGTCAICEINLWAEHNNGPAIFPCGIKDCPYEPDGPQNADFEFSLGGSSLAQLIEGTD